MINNDVCPYCGVDLIKAENQPDSSSVEHLVPNAALTRKRKNDEGDFYACRACNARKSHIDYVLGVVAKCQMDDPQLAAEALTKAVLKDEGTAKKFIKMAQQYRVQADGSVRMTMPIKGESLVEYIEFLAKGQYFKEHKRPFDTEKNLIKIGFTNKLVIQSFQEQYGDKHQSNCFRDLEQNKYSEIINGGECIIYSRNNGYMFVFHDYTIITIQILENNEKNSILCRQKTDKLLKGFDDYS